MPVEQDIGVEQAQVVARAVGIVEPLANLRTRISHKKAGQRSDERGRPGDHKHQEGPGKGMDREHGVSHTPYAAKVRLGKRDASGAQPIQTLKSQIEGHDRKEHPARAANPGADDAGLVAKNNLGRVGEVVAAAEHHADGEEQRRQNDRRTPGVATAKEHVAKRQGEQAGKRKQHDRIGVAGKREKHLVAHVQHARGFGVNRQDCVARHRGGIDGKRRGRQQREQKCDERLLGGVALKPDDASGIARSRCGEVGILHSPKSLSRNLPKRDRFILAGFIWGNVTVLSSLPSKPPQRCLSPLWWYVVVRRRGRCAGGDCGVGQR